MNKINMFASAYLGLHKAIIMCSNDIILIMATKHNFKFYTYTVLILHNKNTKLLLTLESLMFICNGQTTFNFFCHILPANKIFFTKKSQYHTSFKHPQCNKILITTCGKMLAKSTPMAITQRSSGWFTSVRDGRVVSSWLGSNGSICVEDETSHFTFA